MERVILHSDMNSFYANVECLKLEKNAADMPSRRAKDLVDGTSLGKIKSDKIPINNVSGYKGVSWNGKEKKWIANITLKGKRIYLGIYADLEEAIRIRKEAEESYFSPVIEKYSKANIKK